MPKTKISEYSTTNSQNTDIQSINIDEGCAPSGINNAIREVMVHLKNWQTNASGDGATFASLVVQGTGSFTGAVTMSAGATLSGTNTLSGSNIMSGNINSSGTNTFSGSQVISGNINSSGTTNTFSGGNILSGTNTLSGSTIISGNFNATGTTNTFSNALILGNNLTFTGTGNRITGDFSNATTANRVTFKTSTTNGNTSLPIAPNGTGNVASIQLRSYDIDLNSNGNLLQIICSDALGESRFSTQALGSGTAMPMTFYTNGSERMRIDTSGNVGIGTSSPATKLNVVGSVSASDSTTATKRLQLDIGASSGTINCANYGSDMMDLNIQGENLIFNTGLIGVAERMRIDSSGNVSQSAGSYFLVNGGGFGWGTLSTYMGGTSASNFINFVTNNSERMRIDSSGNVGIGTSSPTYRLDAISTGGTQTARFRSGDTATTVDIASFERSDSAVRAVINYNSSDGAMTYGTSTNHPIAFKTNNTERARITSGGALLVGTNAQIFGSDFITNISGTRPLALKNTSTAAGDNSEVIWHVATSGDNRFIEFGTEGTYTIRGSIDYNRAGGQVRYNTTSDYRLKENIVDLPDALQTILQLKPRQFSWKETGNTTTGFIAHELQEVFPDCVSGEKDGIDADGNPRYQGVDTSFLVATLTAAIQELKSELDAAKARIATLESN